VSPPGAAKLNRFEPTPAPFKRRLFFYFHPLRTIPVIAAFSRKARESARDGGSKARVFSFLPFDASRVLRVTDKLAMLPFGDGI
jgi:hypothetical protein